MIKIGVCDDETTITKMLGELIKECLSEMETPGEIKLFDSGEKVLEEIENIDILFLDIEMPTMDGIQVGKRIRERRLNCKIIMAAGKTERVKEVFKFNAFDFITKPFEIEEVRMVLERGIEGRLNMKKLEVFKERNRYMIYMKDIQYIKAEDSYVEFILKNGTFRKDISLTELEKMLDERFFFRINRQYIIDLRWVKKYKNGIIFMEDKNFRVSRRKKKEFERRYIEYDVGLR